MTASASSSASPDSAPSAPGAPRPTSILRRNLALCTGEGLVAMPLVFLTLPGNFIVAALLTQTFPLDKTTFGVIASLPHWCNVIQLLVVPLLTRVWSQKVISLTLAWLHLSVWIALGFMLPHVPREDLDRAGDLFFLILGLSALSHSIVGVAWTSWVQEWVPERLRGKYFGRRNRLIQLSTVLFLLATGEILTRLDSGSSVLGYQIVIGGAVLLRSLSILAQYRILTSSAQRRRETATDLRAQLRVIMRHRALLWLFGFGASFGLLANFFGPFFNVFMYDGLEMSVTEVTMLLVISNVTGAIAMPAWGQFLDRYGNRPTMAFALIMWMLPGFAWAVLTPSNTWILKLLFASGGVFSAGFLLGSFNFLLKLVPPEAKTAAISLNVAVTSLATAIAPIVGGLLLDHAFAAGVDRLQVYHWMAIVHHAIILLAALVLLRVAEPKAAELSQVVGAMRSFRQIFALMGMSFLVNYVFTKERKDRDGS